MSKYWSDTVKKLDPYVPGEQPKDKKYIKLNTNENPYPPSPRVLAAMKAAANEDMRLYPDPNCDELCEVIAGYYGVKREQVFVGNGSDEVLAFAFMAFFNPENPILFPDITYSFYPVYAGLFNIDYRLIPLKEDFTIAVEDYMEENGGIIIPNPNAPTGNCLTLGQVERILSFNIERPVIIDEAYIDFGGETAIKLVDRYPNLLVVHTLSKARSLAGLRVGYAIGQKDLIDGLNSVKNSFNSYTLDRIAIAGAAEAFRDVEYVAETWRKVSTTRERISQELKKMGFEVTDSKSNFVFVSHSRVKAVELFKKMKECGILVRYFNKPRIDNSLRVSIGTDAEMDGFLEVVAQLVK